MKGNRMAVRIMKQESLLEMSMDDLERYYGMIKANIDRKEKRRQPSKQLQVEACYLWRELEVRRARVEAHRFYMQKIRKNRYPRVS